MRSAIIITLIGIGLFFISIFMAEGYVRELGLVYNMYHMEIVIWPGRYEWVEPDRPEIKLKSKDASPGPPREALEPAEREASREEAIEAIRQFMQTRQSEPYLRTVGEISMQLSHAFALSIIIALVGVGKILLSKYKKQKNKPT